MVTDKTKIAFEKWYLKGVHEEGGYDQHVIRTFYSKDISMQIGVYQLFFDSVGIYISDGNYSTTDGESYVYLIKEGSYGVKIESNNSWATRQEAWIKAIEQADKIYNEKN